MVSAPLIGCLHEIPNGFQRPTPYKIAKILKENGAKLICFKKEGSIALTISVLLSEYLNGETAKKYNLLCSNKFYLPTFSPISILKPHLRQDN
jgi:hypothetical protein